MSEAKIVFHIPEGVRCVIAAYFSESGDVLLTDSSTVATGAYPDGGNLSYLRALNNKVWAVAKDGIELYWIADADIPLVANVLHNNGLAKTDLPPETVTGMLLDMLFRFTEPWSLIGATTVTERRETL